MSDRIEELRKAYDAASDALAAAAYAATYAAYAADDAKRQWRKAKAALEAAEKEVKND